MTGPVNFATLIEHQITQAIFEAWEAEEALTSEQEEVARRLNDLATKVKNLSSIESKNLIQEELLKAQRPQEGMVGILMEARLRTILASMKHQVHLVA